MPLDELLERETHSCEQRCGFIGDFVLSDGVCVHEGSLHVIGIGLSTRVGVGYRMATVGG